MVLTREEFLDELEYTYRSEKACETLWRLRAESTISKEDYEVLRDALYKLADLENDIIEHGFWYDDGTYICPKAWADDLHETLDNVEENGEENGWSFVIAPSKKWFMKKEDENAND